MIYLNSKDEKWVMYLMEIVRFCDATLEKVLKEAKLKIFQSEPWKKPPLLGELDRDIRKAFERERSKLLSHRQQIRRLLVCLDYDLITLIELTGWNEPWGSSVGSKMSFHQALDLILKLDETMDECTWDILRKRDFFGWFREVSWVIPTFVVIEGE
nr:hypothetical protein [Tanacetum cinerariifolium]GFA50032.1 hypothetical protein [Tanacetum cinerariifolium]